MFIDGIFMGNAKNVLAVIELLIVASNGHQAYIFWKLSGDRRHGRCGRQGTAAIESEGRWEVELRTIEALEQRQQQLRLMRTGNRNRDYLID